MKGLLRALVGILATVVIVILIERTMVSFEFFPDDETKVADTTSLKDMVSADTLAVATNEIIKGSDLITISEGVTIKANKVYKKGVPLDDEYLVNITKSDTIQNYMNEVEIQFEIEDKKLVNSMQFLVIDGFDTKNDKTYKQFYTPIEGVNTLKLKNNFSEGTHIFRVGYFFKRDIERKKYKFYHKEFKLFVIE